MGEVRPSGQHNIRFVWCMHAALFCTTVRDVAIEIDLREAVSRFLNVCAKSGGQSVDFYFPHAARNPEIRRTTCRRTSFFWRTRFWPPMIAPARVGHAWPSIRIFAYVIMMFLPSQLSSVGELRPYAARPRTRE